MTITKMNMFLLIIILIATGIAGMVMLGHVVFPKNQRPHKQQSDRYIICDNVKIRFREINNEKFGPCVVFLHAFGGSLESWNEIAPLVKAARVIWIDIPGFGYSTFMANPDYSLESQRIILEKFFDALNLQEVILVGSSMGASISLWSAAFDSKRINAVVASAPSAYPGSMRHHWPMDYVYRPGLINSALTVIVKSGFFNFVSPQSIALQSLQISASYDTSFVDVLKTIKQPVTILWSKGDTRVPFQYSNRYVKIMPQAQLIEMDENAGHSVATKDPEATAEIVNNLIVQIQH